MLPLYLLNLCYLLMTKSIVYLIAGALAVLTVLGSRLLIPALIIIFRSIEASFAPATDVAEEPAPLPAVVADVPAPVKPRRARRRKPTAKSLALLEAVV